MSSCSIFDTLAGRECFWLLTIGLLGGIRKFTAVTKRRKLPAPPLVLQPYLVRVPERSAAGEKLRKLGRFLFDRRLLTGGGETSLKSGLRGRNGVVSLSLQDVRSWAHGMVLELWELEDERWDAAAEMYSGRFDKGKPRRPNALQRLYLEWSSDYSWAGLLDACRCHSHLWGELGRALTRLDPEYPDRQILEIALQCREDFAAWDRAFLQGVPGPARLFRLLGRLGEIDRPSCLLRLRRAAQALESAEELPSWTYQLLCASACPMSVAHSLPSCEDLETLAQRFLATFQGFHEPSFLCGFRGYIGRTATLKCLFANIKAGDPLRRVCYGPRPGTEWLEVLRAELERLISLRSGSFSP
jgi:hypothetical protein